MHPFLDLMKLISAVGSSPIIFLIAALVLIFLLAKKERLRALILVIGLCSGLYSYTLKGYFAETRPTGYVARGFIIWERYLKNEVYSFPSSHVIIYTVFFGYLFYLSYTLRGVDRVLRRTTRLLSGIFMVSVGVSRVVLGAHFVTDVVFGYVFGFVYLTALITVEKFLVEKQSKKQLKHKTR